MSRADNIFLVGFMGVGKSAAGKLLAEKLEHDFFETDSLVEKTADKDINQIFKDSGESVFRAVETTVLKKVSLKRNAVISCGGGIILREENRKIMSESGTTVFLNASPETLLSRLIESKNSRPLLDGLSDPEKLDRINGMLAERIPLYRRSDLTINTDD
ncbi:MAG: shikimate kinase, partial [Candidatus Marinimicrobia bacterium]|nr:shikimate kinase [Candidatus Neomarinimicrobiota bacterium]